MTQKNNIKHWKSATIHESDLGEFREIPKTGGHFKISQDGVVVSCRRRALPTGWWLVVAIKKSTNSKPFNRCAVSFDGQESPSTCHVSRLILEAWIGPPPSPMHVAAHRNGVTDDDRLENLMWALAKDVKHGSICRGTWARGETSGNPRYVLEQIEAARKIIIKYEVPVNLLATAMGLTNTRVTEWLTTTWDESKWEGLENPLLAECSNQS